MTTSNHSRVLWTLLLLISLWLLNSPVQAKYRGGAGTADNPYQIATARDLLLLGESPEDYDKHFILIADIDLSSYSFKTAVIAPDSPDVVDWGHNGTPFTGFFDGDGHVISNLTIDDDGAGNDFLGLFGLVYRFDAEIRNLGLENASITGGNDSMCLGILSGDNHGSIRNCYSRGNVTGGNHSSNVGGLCGSNYGRMNNCYSTADVIGGSKSIWIGGLCGDNYGGGCINNSYAIGRVAGDRGIGGLVGWGGSSGITNCFWDKQTSGLNTSAGGWSKTTEEMKRAVTFIGWNDGSWVIDEGHDYPRLTWENSSGTVISTGYPVRTYPGWGTLNRPFELDSPEDLICFSLRKPDWNSDVILTGSIDMRGRLYYPIPDFTGNLDGQGFVISHLTINSHVIGKRDELGLFGTISRLGSQPQIKNVGLQEISITGADYSWHLGGLCGISSGRISGCYSTGTVTATGNGSSYIGGLCGYHYGEMTFCYSEVSIGGDFCLGSLCGRNSGSIDNCFSTGDVTGRTDSDSIGGLCGYNGGPLDWGGSISNCHSDGNVTGGTGSSRIGGLCGCNHIADIRRCYSTGDVIGGTDTRYLGGLCGYNEDGNISTCHSKGSVQGDRYLGGLCGCNHYADIRSCYSTGDVTGRIDTDWVGGLCGYNEYGTISSCYSKGLVKGNNYLGGLCGLNIGHVSYCYSTSVITGEAYSRHLGGLCGNNSGDVVSCFWDVETSGQNGSSGGIGLLTSEMMDPMFYSLNGWANDPNWILDAGKDYPHLAWEQIGGQSIPESTMEWIDGNGTLENPYRISDSYQLSLVGKTRLFHDKHLSLSADIDYEGLNTMPVGYYWDEGFMGVFDGNDHEIRNLKIDLPNERDVGLFGHIREGTVIKSLRVTDANITGSERVGGIIGYNNGGTIIHCDFDGAVTGRNDVGGIAGSSDKVATISNCSSAGTVSGNSSIGGIVGRKGGGTLTQCHFEGSVVGSRYAGGIVGSNNRSDWDAGITSDCVASGNVTGENCVGGIAGENWFSPIGSCGARVEIEGYEEVGGLVGFNCGEIGNCYATGSVTGTEAVGGLVGSNLYQWEDEEENEIFRGEIVHCYSAGLVSGDFDAGGLVGFGSPHTVQSSFWDIETSGQMNSEGGEGKTTAEMQNAKTFTDAGWDFDRPIWTIEGQDYPQLAWDRPTHVFRIEIFKGYDYEDPGDPDDTEYEFRLVVLTDGTVENIEFVTPAGELLEIAKIPEEQEIEGGRIEIGREYEIERCAYEWYFDTEFDDPDSLDAYGDGDYTIIIHYGDGRQEQTTAWFGIPGTNDPIPQVVQEPTFTSFAHQDRLACPLMIEWEPPVNPDVNLIRFDLENQDTDEECVYELGAVASGLDDPFVISEGLWEANLAFGIMYETDTIDGIHVWCVKYSVSDYIFTIISP